MRRGGTPDPDCPQCLESIRYLCTKKKNLDETEKVEQRGEARVNVKSTAEGVASLMSLSSAPSKPAIGSVASAESTSALEIFQKLADTSGWAFSTSGCGCDILNG